LRTPTRLLSKRNNALLRELVSTDFKLRYEGSAIGYAWSLLRPLLIFLILYVVFARLLRLGTGIPHYPIYLLMGLTIWNFFADMTNQGLGSIVARGDILRKVQIPHWIIVVSATLSVAINLLFNLVVLAIFMIAARVPVGWTVLALPLLFAEVYIFSLGISFFLAAAFVKYRDVRYMWEVVNQAFFYLTPIIYPLTRIHNDLIRKLILINPLAQAIQDARYVTVTKTATTISSEFHTFAFTLVPLAIMLAAFLIGSTYFRRRSPSFAEDL
jgi:ABC-2 type transport system permease protein